MGLRLRGLRHAVGAKVQFWAQRVILHYTAMHVPRSVHEGLAAKGSELEDVQLVVIEGILRS